MRQSVGPSYYLVLSDLEESIQEGLPGSVWQWDDPTTIWSTPPLYKNKVRHTNDFCKENLEWMKQTMEKQQLPPAGWIGGIPSDEMTIQDDIQINKGTSWRHNCNSHVGLIFYKQVLNLLLQCIHHSAISNNYYLVQKIYSLKVMKILKLNYRSKMCPQH